ncbi:MAG TPA: hypothetical protein VFU47_16095 [Armatimonadota bacterium]|nr:hypothetical protein [Armatimonadota bacterium]
MYDVDDFIRQAREELAAYDGHERRFEALLAENETRSAELRQRLEAAWQQLGALALPQPDPAALAELAQRVRLPGLNTLGEQSRARAAAIEARVAEIDATPLYADRESRRVHIQAQLDEEGPLFDFARQELEKLEALPGMRELVEKGWGTPRYPHRGWLRYFNPRFLNDWKRADQIVEALKVPDFPRAAALYQERVEQATALGGAVQQLRGELQQIESLERERAALLAEREALPQVLQQRAGRMLGEMLETRGKEGVSDLPAPEDAARVAAVIEGVQHQIGYLEQMSGQIRGDLGQLLDRSGRLREEMRRYESDRYRYRNKRFTQEQFGKRFGRTARYAKRYERYDRMGQTVYVFHDYDRGLGLGDLLWWDLMTDGRFDGNFIPEVAEWRQAHPDYTYVGGRDMDLGPDSSFLRDDS